LGELGRYVNGRGFKKSEWAKAGRPIIRIQNLTGSGSGFNYYAGEADERHVVRRGDLLVSWAATLGVYEWDGPEAVLNQHIFKVESLIDRRFHRYLIERTLNQLQAQAHGTGMVHITRGPFERTPVLVPPRAEQRRIVEAIEEQFSRLDAAERSLAGAQEKLKALRRAGIALAVAQSATEERPLSDTVEVLDSKRVPVNAQERAKRPGTVPYFGATGQVGWIDKPLFDEQLVLLGEDAAPFLDASKPKAYVIEGPSWVNNHAHVLRARPELANAWYLKFALDCVDYRPLVTGTTRLKLTQASMQRIELPMPGIAVQERLVAELQARLSIEEALENEVDVAGRRSGALRRAILREAFAGRLVA
jgi:type I restriction enzyme S subunit